MHYLHLVYICHTLYSEIGPMYWAPIDLTKTLSPLPLLLMLLFPCWPYNLIRQNGLWFIFLGERQQSLGNKIATLANLFKCETYSASCSTLRFLLTLFSSPSELKLLPPLIGSRACFYCSRIPLLQMFNRNKKCVFFLMLQLLNLTKTISGKRHVCSKIICKLCSC